MKKKLLKNIEWDETIVCFCAGVTRREIAEALALGYQSVESLAERTRASTGCGICISVLSGLVERRHEVWNNRDTVELAEPLFVHESQPFLEKQKSLIAGSLLGLILSFPVLFLGSLPNKEGLLSNEVFRILKGEAFGSRMTGFALLFMVLLAGALSLYKRRPGRYGQNLYRGSMSRRRPILWE